MLLAVSIDLSKSFNLQQVLPLLVFGVLMFVGFNWKPILAWWNNRKANKEAFTSETLDYRYSEEPQEITEAEYRVMLFGWIDEIRSYAMENKNEKALATANELLNDLLATPLPPGVTVSLDK